MQSTLMDEVHNSPEGRMSTLVQVQSTAKPFTSVSHLMPKAFSEATLMLHSMWSGDQGLKGAASSFFFSFSSISVYLVRTMLVQ
eukprot:2915546-Amphidinium_carterae.2